MIATNFILARIVDLLAADATTLADPADAMHVHLVKDPFTPAPDLVVGDFTLADFTGATPLDAGLGAQQVFIDAASGLRTIQLLEPAGGWTWEVVTNDDNLPQSIYGFIVTDNADTELYGMGQLTSPVPLTAVGQGLTLPNIRFTFLPGSPS